MQLDTVTMSLSGREVPLATFASAIVRFSALVRALSAEAGRTDLEWIVDELSRGSTLAVARGIGNPDQVARVVRRYGEVGMSLADDAPLKPYSPPVRIAAGRLRGIVGGAVEAMLLETPEREAIVRPRIVRMKPAPAARSPILMATAKPPVAAFGAIEGRIQTLTNRGGLRFTLYDTLEDRAVSCYLAEGSDEIMRGAWGRRAVVEGWVVRDPMTGRPLTVRQVRSVHVKPDPEPDGYISARGIAPSLSGLLPEQAIRRLRDA
jgi:hypothetical protein